MVLEHGDSDAGRAGGHDEAAERYDVIVIGSGMGGLAAASILAQLKKRRVLVLESHFTLGGYLHSFKRHGHEWDPGFHYVGEMDKGQLTRACMDLVTGGRVDWQRLDPMYEQLIFPDDTVDVPSSEREHLEDLQRQFPDEAEAIERYFKDLRKAKAWSQRWFYSKVWPLPIASLMARPGRKLAESVTSDELDARFESPLLKAILTAQWGDYGTPPGRSAFGVHAAVAGDFLGGGSYAVGGSQKIADSVKAIVEEHGGRCLTRHRVTEILIDDNRAHGVVAETTKGPKRFLAPQIISAAGIDKTFRQFVPSRWAAVERDRVTTAVRGMSATILFMGIKDDPRKFGFRDTNYWMFDRLDHGYEPETVGFPPSIGNTTLSFASLRNPALDKHVAQLVTFSWYDDWARFRDLPWKKRGEEYERLKEEYIENLLDFVEERIPGLREIITYRELATPVTFESMSSHPFGQVYGRECSPQRLKDEWTIGTSVKGLYLTGTDIVIPGVNSALMSGVMTAAKLIGPHGMFQIMRVARKVETVAEPVVRHEALPI